MRRGCGLLGAAALLSCGGPERTGLNLNFFVDPPPMGDVSCIGVAGFEVEVTSASKRFVSEPLLNNAPVLDPSSCRLIKPFSIQDVDVDAPASVVVTGYDGAGITRVQGTGRVDNLQVGPTRIQLNATATPPTPVLVVHRAPLLSGASVDDIVRLAVVAMGAGRPTLVDVGPGAFSKVEPGAYGVPTNLARDGSSTGQAVAIEVTTKQGTLPPARSSVVWNVDNKYYEAQ